MRARRAFIVGTLSLLAAPLAAEAQPVEKVYRIGYLSMRSGPSYLDEAFRHRLRELGYIEGQNLSIDYRWADWKPDRAVAFAAELVRLKVEVIVATGGGVSALAAKKTTDTIPIIFTAGDPVEAGLVARLDRPGGNLTGINVLTVELNAKRLDLLKEAIPAVSHVSVLVNPGNPTTRITLKDLEGTARALRLKLQVLEVRERQEIDTASTVMARERAEALLVVSDAMFFAQRERIVDLAVRHRLPAIFEWREFADAGGLLSYGTNIAEMYRRLAGYVDKVLRGAKPGDLPVEQPTRYELVINMKTAKALGLTIPPSVIARADEVIE
jgi:putative ABC transport system substrate-binding protein